MGGSGSYFPTKPNELTEIIQKSQENAVKQQIDSDVNDALQMILVTYNERDVDQVRDYLEKLEEVLGVEYEIENFLFGGSVSKHTFVNGLSDIDALVILDRTDLEGETPQTTLNEFHKMLQGNLMFDEIKSIMKGQMAITVTYRDGTEIQLLPAIRKGKAILIPSSDPNSWNETNPAKFRRLLTRANESLNGNLVPTIKLVKSINERNPENRRLISYHVESLCLEAVKNYDGPKTYTALLSHILRFASNRVLKSMRDVTGQETNIDSNLGKSNSHQRKNISITLGGIAKKIDKATTVEEWMSIFED